MTSRTRPLAALAAASAAALLLTSCASIGRPEGSAGAGYQAGDGSFATWSAEERGAPVDLTGQSYEGTQIDLAEWRGDVVVMNFWYAACPPCRKEAPDLVDLAEEYPEIHMLGVNPRDDAGTAQAFERTFSIPYPSLWDQDASGVAAMQGLVPLQAMPTTVILDREGKVASRILGQADPTILRGLVDDVLAEADA
ncbi:MAG: TlpA disulfide reductase family protein [bacterium]|nr:TlpA disulfide reductase family protein [bacterium]